MAVESVLERTLPQSLDAEMSVIGAMLLDNEVINVVVPILNKQSFYKTAHQSIYQAIIDLYDKGQAIDLVLLREELKKRSLLENVGGARQDSIKTAYSLSKLQRGRRLIIYLRLTNMLTSSFLVAEKHSSVPSLKNRPSLL